MVITERDLIMIKYVIFDCFGTLINTGSTSLSAAAEILRNVGSDADPEEFYKSWKAVKKEMMSSGEFRTEKDLFRLSLAEMFSRYGIDADAEKEADPMIGVLFARRAAFPETHDALRMLSAAGIEYAIGSTTDTDSILYYLEQNMLDPGRLYTSEDMKLYKPDPRFYSTILEKTGWNAEECLFVGDSITDDVKGPQEAGMKAALLIRNTPYDQNCGVKPDYIIHSLLELEFVLK